MLNIVFFLFAIVVIIFLFSWIFYKFASLLLVCFIMKTKILISIIVSLVASAVCAQDVCYSLKRIWGDGSTHCAFTSLV